VFVEALEDQAFGGPVGAVQQLDERLHATGGGQVALLGEGREALLEGGLDRGDDLGGRAVHGGDTHGDVTLGVLGQTRQHDGRGLG
jgi:hypothetical protein